LSKLSLYPMTLDGTDIQKKRQEIKEYFNNTFDLYEKVFELLKDDSVFYEKSEITRHPMIFYFGHTATFFVNKLINMKVISQRIDASFESIFAVGVDEMSWDDVDSKNYNWPEVSEVREYRKKVKDLVNDLIMNLELTLPITQDSAMWIIIMGIEHERIHIETSLVLHRQMPIELIKEVKDFVLCNHSDEAPVNSLIDIHSKEIKLGKTKEHNLYGWDNEYGEYKESLNDFQVSKFLVSNGEYMNFVKDGGYENKEFWDDEGKRFLDLSGLKYPVFWVLKNDKYMYRALSKIIPMPQDWPVEVNALEAEAFCRYKSKQDNKEYLLPSEAEDRAIYEQTNLKDIPNLHESGANINFNHYASSSPVNEFAFSISTSDMLYDVIGNVWQWSRTPIFGFKGFEVHEAYDDFSTPTFDDKHALILGSSWASSGNLIMKHSRYAFRKHFYQFAGFRYVVSKNTKNDEIDIYESDELISQYCEFQYGDDNFGVRNFALNMAEIASKFSINTNKALDLGCATGRATFELAKTFKKVDGVDFSARFIGVGVKLQESGFVAFHTNIEGDLTQNKKINLEELGYEKLVNKVSFYQGDACNLKPNFNSYDLIMATNLIDRLYNPMLFLQTIDERLNDDGILILTSPYTWQENSTKKEFWLGGYKDENGEEVRTIDNLKNILNNKFKLLHVEDVEFVIRETQRKYQHSIAEVSIWKKR